MRVEHNGIKCDLRDNSSDLAVWEDNIVRFEVAKHLDVSADQKWLDIGSYIGTFSLSVLNAGASVFAVEAWDKHVDIYKSNLLLNDYVPNIIQGAVLNRTDEEEIQLILGSHSRYNNHAANTLFNRWKRDHDTVSVPAYSFARVCELAFESLGEDNLHLKLDIEGAEVEILENANLSRFRQIYFEYHYQFDNSAERVKKIVARLESFGFNVGTSRPIREPKHWNEATFMGWAKK